MTYTIKINPGHKTTKKEQIVNAFVNDIESGFLKFNEKLPSINEFSKTHKIARETIEKAYKLLKQKGYIISIPGIGNYVAKGAGNQNKILMLVNKISEYKNDIYEAFIKVIGSYAKVELKIYHYDPKLFREIIVENLDQFDYFVIMPHFYAGTPEAEFMEVIAMIDPKKLVVLDKEIFIHEEYISIYQDFRNDIFDAFSKQEELFQKYDHLKIIFRPDSHHPEEILDGVKEFATKQTLKFSTVHHFDVMEISPGEVYITLNDTDLGKLINKIRIHDYTLGKEIGIVSFNETILKELLDITVISTDFKAMGEKAGHMILNRELGKYRNSFVFLRRGSL
ncbi:hypothetical protein ASE74_20800 [Pedobacter sp. Leaf216]|uniref:GntR family transcriptional regulator n=1 Tax=Pedobacter sp. Leaf216 TaxID=1735684 RepID=UPI0006F83938|nr:GntR family transcriptional regulator [Pedobacter sp. Leaf216]KQM75261.1 hypothetical protein ASE74_20800 [Pedobacter sp. Leaf216]